MRQTAAVKTRKLRGNPRVIDQTRPPGSVTRVPHTIDILLAAATVAAAPLTSRYARRRALSQPLDAHPEIEQKVLDTLAEHPGWYVYVHQLRGEHFTAENRAHAWRRIEDENSDIDFPQLPASEKKAYALLEKLETSVQRHGESNGQGAGYLSREELVDAAGKIYNAGLDRGDYSGDNRIVETGDPDKPLRRELPPVTVRRDGANLLVHTAGAVAALAAGGNHLSVAALLLLTIGSAIWLWVDIDTMYIDTRSFLLFGAAAWAAAVGGATTDGRAADALLGLAVSAAIVVFIEAINQIYRRVRHQHGMGTGDYMLIAATIGVPAAVTGSWALGQGILIASLGLGILGWLLKRATQPGFTRETPYAFGPYLACGWMVGVLLWAAL